MVIRYALMDDIQCILLDSAELSNNWRTLVAAITLLHHFSLNEAGLVHPHYDFVCLKGMLGSNLIIISEQKFSIICILMHFFCNFCFHFSHKKRICTRVLLI